MVNPDDELQLVIREALKRGHGQENAYDLADLVKRLSKRRAELSQKPRDVQILEGIKANVSENYYASSVKRFVKSETRDFEGPLQYSPGSGTSSRITHEGGIYRPKLEQTTDYSGYMFEINPDTSGSLYRDNLENNSPSSSAVKIFLGYRTRGNVVTSVIKSPIKDDEKLAQYVSEYPPPMSEYVLMLQTKGNYSPVFQYRRHLGHYSSELLGYRYNNDFHEDGFTYHIATKQDMSRYSEQQIDRLRNIAIAKALQNPAVSRFFK